MGLLSPWLGVRVPLDSRMGIWKVEPDVVVLGERGFKISDAESGRYYFTPNQEAADYLADSLNTANSSVVKLYCRTVGCRGVNGFITRGAVDARKNVYRCDDCGHAMVK